MTDHYKKPDFLIEVSWEVCNLVGGIYTVLSTKAKTLHDLYDDHLIFIGPDVWHGTTNPYFKESNDVLKEWKFKAGLEGLKVRTGRWNIPGEPIVILVDFEQYYVQRDKLYANMWNWYQVDSLHAYGDYDEACMFAYASALVTESLYHFFEGHNKNIVAQFNEWTTGMGLLYLKKRLPCAGVVFTTHATSIGRSIAGNNKPLYDQLANYNGDQMAQELNMVAKHSLEKRAAHEADCFTAVSHITARECEQLLERKPLVTPNGFEENFVPRDEKYALKRSQARAILLTLAERLVGYTPKKDAMLVATAGRYEYKNKGIDVFLDGLNILRSQNPARDVIAFILVPAWVSEARHDLKFQMQNLSYHLHPLPDPLITHGLHNYNHDSVMNKLNQLRFKNQPGDTVKVIFVPSYLKGDDGILNLTYYNLLIGMDVTVFPSYYEPWGYTPLESIAFGVPTITTDLSGFGRWAESEGAGNSIFTGVRVIKRDDKNAGEVSRTISQALVNLSRASIADRAKIQERAQQLSHEANWGHFIRYYKKAYDEAIQKANTRIHDRKLLC